MARFSRNLALLLAASVLLSPGAMAAPKQKPITRISPAAARATPVPLGPGELPLYAEGAIVIDALSGAVLYEKNADARYYPASTTKVMTALMVI